MSDNVPNAALTIEQSVERREKLKEFVRRCLVQGTDYEKAGEGQSKDVLYKPGAEKMRTFYGLNTQLQLLEKIEDWQNGFFFYRYLTQVYWLKPDKTEALLFEAIGSCNSKESMFAGRWMLKEQLTKEQQQLAVDGKLQAETRASWQPKYLLSDEMLGKALDEKWKENMRKSVKGNDVIWVFIPDVTLYFVPNKNINNEVNTIDKVSQKRSFVGAVIGATDAGDMFSPDQEDKAKNEDQPTQVELLEQSLKEKKKPKGKKVAAAAMIKQLEEEKTEAELKLVDGSTMTEEQIYLAMENAKSAEVLSKLIGSVPEPRSRRMMEKYMVETQRFNKRKLG